MPRYHFVCFSLVGPYIFGVTKQWAHTQQLHAFMDFIIPLDDLKL